MALGRDPWGLKNGTENYSEKEILDVVAEVINNDPDIRRMYKCAKKKFFKGFVVDNKLAADNPALYLGIDTTSTTGGPHADAGKISINPVLINPDALNKNRWVIRNWIFHELIHAFDDRTVYGKTTCETLVVKESRAYWLASSAGACTCQEACQIAWEQAITSNVQCAKVPEDELVNIRKRCLERCINAEKDDPVDECEKFLRKTP